MTTASVQSVDAGVEVVKEEVKVNGGNRQTRMSNKIKDYTLK